jgi:diguanylate cyclase (GGDEF)-like protein
MSLIRQLWLLLLGTVLVGIAGGTLVTVGAAREDLEAQLQRQNADSARSLALALSQARPEGTPIGSLLSGQFGTGAFERLRLLAPDGDVIAEHRAAPATPAAPAWFVRAVPIAQEPGTGQVSDGGQPIGRLEVTSAAGFAHDALWRASLRSAAWLAAVGLAAAAGASLLLRRIRAPLAATVEQAGALLERRFVVVDEPAIPELRQLSQAMNGLVQRLQGVFAEQGGQLEALQRQAQTDPLTGLPHREHFLARLASLRERDDAPPAGALLLVRMRTLAALNREHGHGAIDRLLRTVAATLENAGWRHEDALPGRLNGSDLALLVPGADPAALGAELLTSLRAALAAVPEADLAVGAIAWRAETAVGALMRAADAALARAEMQSPFGLAVDVAQPGPPALGEAQWHRALSQSIERRDAALAAFPVVGRHGGLLHLESPLRLRLQENGPLEPAARWLPWALRSQLAARADLLAVGLALDATGADARPRGVNLAPDSLRDGGFLPGLHALLEARPAQARLLWLEFGESAALGQLALLGELGRELRPFGTRLGLEHAGEKLARVERLYEAGLDYVKLDAALCAGLQADGARGDFVRGLVSALHGVGVQVIAEGVASEADARALWACGLDGLTGPWVVLPAPAIAAAVA